MPTDSRTKNVRLRNMSAYFIKTHMFTIFCLSLAETIDTQKPSFSLQRARTLWQKRQKKNSQASKIKVNANYSRQIGNLFSR